MVASATASTRWCRVEDRLGLADSWVSPLHLASWQAVAQQLASSARDIFYYTALIPPFISAAEVTAQVQALHLRRELLARAEGFLRQQQIGQRVGDFLGVQIRKTDFGSHAADDGNLFTLVSQCPQHF